MERGAEVAQPCAWCGVEPGAQGLEQAGFADPRFAADQNDLPRTTGRQAPEFEQPLDLALPLDQRRQADAAHRLEPPCAQAPGDHMKGRNRLLEARQLTCADVFQIEQIAEQTPRRRRDHHRSRFRQGLKAGRKIWRFPDDRFLLGSTLANQVPYDDQPGCDPDACR